MLQCCRAPQSFSSSGDVTQHTCSAWEMAPQCTLHQACGDHSPTLLFSFPLRLCSHCAVTSTIRWLRIRCSWCYLFHYPATSFWNDLRKQTTSNTNMWDLNRIDICCTSSLHFLSIALLHIASSTNTGVGVCCIEISVPGICSLYCFFPYLVSMQRAPSCLSSWI